MSVGEMGEGLDLNAPEEETAEKQADVAVDGRSRS